MADAGWTKKKLKEFLMKVAESPMDSFWKDQEKEKQAKDILSQPPAAVDPDSLLIVVAGGPGAWTGLLRSVGGIKNDFVTKKIRLPGNWDKLVKKYKDVVPAYATY